MSRYSWIILDADNTVFDFDRAEHAALARTLGGFGIECTETVRSDYAAISAKLWRAFEAGEMTSGRLRVARFEELLRGASRGVPGSPRGDQEHSGAGIADAVSARYVLELGRESGLLPEAEPVVRRLASTHRLLLATNGISDIQRSRFGASVVADCFEDVVISDEIGVAKPHAGFFDEVFRRMGDPAKDRVLMVGDSLSSDIAGGIGYGIDTCWFDLRCQGDAATSKFDPPLRPTYRILELRELLGVVQGEELRRTL